ncbi:MAG: NYN domain-containing protein [Xanthomonadaceae bacterium]|nr:NYN domain-containing protein [Xanthomonadaceae bacterium]
MNRIAVFVDAGYFWVQVAQVVHGGKNVRDSVVVDYTVLREQVLAEAAAQFPRAELLRVYWYDGPGANGGKAHSHVAIDDLDDFKLRLGTRNTYGDQKAVDGLIIADLIGLAQARVITGAIVLSGDSDLAPGVVAAQGLGLRVHMLSMGPANATSPFLRAEVDCKRHWEDDTVRLFASASAIAHMLGENAIDGAHGDASSLTYATTADSITENGIPLSEVAAAALANLPSDETEPVLANGALTRSVDALLLRVGRIRFCRPLTEPEKRALREEMKKQLSARVPS